MKILLYCLNYAPELTGIGKYMGEQAQWLAARGHEVRVIAAPPYYPAWRVGDGYRAWRYRREVLDGVTVYRAPLWVPARPGGLKRLLHLASFAVSSLPCLAAQLRWRPDVVFAVEPALMCSPAALLLASWCGSKCWLHVQDFEVDAAFALGVLRQPVLQHMATWIERAVMSRYDRVSSISHAMTERARSKGVPRARLMMLPNWASLDDPAPVPGHDFRRMLGIPGDAVIALYSGNMGNKQGLDVLASAARCLRDDATVHFILCGDGTGRAALEQACKGLARVHFLPLQPTDRFPALLAAADIHLLPQRADAADLVMPSKLTGMLASRRPVIATAAPGTELGQLVSRVGVLVPPGDGESLAHEIAALARAPQRRESLAMAGREWAEANLDREMVLKRFEDALKALVNPDAAQTAAAVSMGAD